MQQKQSTSLFPLLMPFLLSALLFPPTLGQENSASATMKCRANEIFNSCGKRCEAKCGDPPGGRPCPKICDPPACMCAEGFARNNVNGRCVEKEKCPRPRCPRNESYVECSSMCEPNCADPPGEVRACIMMCGPAKCQCRQNYTRDNATGHCVRPADCSTSSGDGVPTNPCAVVLCMEGSNCEVVNGQAKCVPLDVCATVRCRSGTKCVPRVVQCFAPPCPPIAECVPVSSSSNDDDAD